MAERPGYEHYVADDFMQDYLRYQERYAEQVRESDRVVIEHVVRFAANRPSTTVLDIGCSTGNLLRHLQRLAPNLDLHGGELSEESLDICRRDPELNDVSFHHMDATQLRRANEFDVIIASATFCLFTPEQYAAALATSAAALRPGGILVTFDWLHDFPQDLEIIERSKGHPEGMTLYFRSTRDVEPVLRKAGFAEWSFEPFEIPVDLALGERFDGESAFEELNSYTVPAADGRRLLFRGTLFQPWCHLVARMPGTQ